MLEDIEKYTDTYMMFSMWSWDADDVIEGESAGICMEPTDKPETYASCWFYTRNTFGDLEGPKSLLIDPKIISPESRLEDQEVVNSFTIPGMYGNWMCMEPMEIFGRVRVSCARFVPKEDTVEDPAYRMEDDVTVTTYLTGRLTGRLAPPTPLNGN